ncbi:MAG: hypothetical protein M1274_15810, partial [Actinobacteria bacterium]|nr:hypothetical protein [Actinomycetota bacterium]
DSFRLQRRARAIAGTVAREEDAPQIVLTASTLDQILFVTNRGRAYNIKAHELPDTGRQARGLPLSNFFSLQPDERAVGAVAIRSFERDAYLLYVTRNGDVKRVALSEYSSTRSAGINALNIAEKDELVFVGLGEGKSELMVFSEGGQAIRFNEDEVRASGRTSGGIRAIRLKGDDRVAAAGTVRGEQVVVVTQNGFHKRCSLSEFPMQSRGGGGVRAHSVTSKTGPLAGATVAADGDEILIVSSGGLVLRSPVDAIPAAGRATQGTALSGLDKKDKISGVARLESREGPGKQPIEATADGGSPSTAAPSSRGEAKTSANSGGKGIAKTASKSDQTQETAELKTSSKSKGAQAGGKPASAAKESAKQSAKKSAKATASSKTVTSKGAKAKAPATKVVQKSTPPAKAKKTVEAEPEERFTQRIIIPPREETAKPAKSPAPKPSVRSSASTASSKPAEKDGQAKKSTLFGSIASSLSKSVSGEKKQPEGKAAPQPTLPLFGGSQGKKETIEPSSADGKKTAGAGKAKSEPEKKSPAAKAVKAATKPAKPKK